MTRRAPSRDPGPGALTFLFQEALRNARRTGDDRRIQLRAGARLGVRCRDGEIALTIARPGVAVGDTETAVFRRDCEVPATARRIPEAGQRQRTDEHGITWHWLAFTWPDPEATTEPAPEHYGHDLL